MLKKHKLLLLFFKYYSNDNNITALCMFVSNLSDIFLFASVVTNAQKFTAVPRDFVVRL